MKACGPDFLLMFCRTIISSSCAFTSWIGGRWLGITQLHVMIKCSRAAVEYLWFYENSNTRRWVVNGQEDGSLHLSKLSRDKVVLQCDASQPQVSSLVLRSRNEDPNTWESDEHTWSDMYMYLVLLQWHKWTSPSLTLTHNNISTSYLS